MKYSNQQALNNSGLFFQISSKLSYQAACVSWVWVETLQTWVWSLGRPRRRPHNLALNNGHGVMIQNNSHVPPLLLICYIMLLFDQSSTENK